MNKFSVIYPDQDSKDVELFLSGTSFPIKISSKEHTDGTHDFINISIDKPEWKGFYKFKSRWSKYLTVLTETNKVYYIYYERGEQDINFNDFKPFIRTGMTLDLLMKMYML